MQSAPQAEAAAAPADQPAQNVISLAGQWRFRLDAGKVGDKQAWYNTELPGRIALPGSTDEAGYGTKTEGPAHGHLSRPWRYEGPAWYQRDVNIPETWKGKRITLLLERCHWETRVWVDDKAAGMRNSLCVPHVYDLSDLLGPGAHRLTIRVDNTIKINVGRWPHSITDHTQTNWNGIVGRIELEATDPVWIDAVRVFPNVKDHSARIEADIRNTTGRKLPAALAAVAFADRNMRAVASASRRLDAVGERETVSVALSLKRNPYLWDEYTPRLYSLSLTLDAGTEKARFRHAKRVTFGLREFTTRGTQFLMNGRPTFLRGTLECCIFPLTGYPPTDAAAWERICRIARSYGLNHLRFHSWCPPEAAFVAADRAGIYLQPELPVWSPDVGKDAKLGAFMRAEAQRIFEAYGNHPSFTNFSLGNELTGNWRFMNDLIRDLKRMDSRRLYVPVSNNRGRPPEPASDYHIPSRTPKGPVRIHHSRRSLLFKATLPGTDYDYSASMAGYNLPSVTHEIGQWVVYPDYREIAKYTGVLKPRNLEHFRDTLAARGMADQAGAFHRASGAFSRIIYKEEIEAQLRTPNFSGFQLLDLHDFPGQGEALVGMLDPFWDSKGLVTPKEFRRFCGPTVPLLRLKKFVWTAGETFGATVQVRHYGRSDLKDAQAEWSIRDDTGGKLASGRLEAAEIPVGSLTTLGRIRADLSSVRRARHFKVEVAVRGTPCANDWDIWVYPKQVDLSVPPGVTLTGSVDDARKALAEGGKVLLFRPAGRPGPGAITTRFLPVFWSLSWFSRQPGTLGILCDPKHPALSRFPTDFHSNWQWWDITQPSTTFILNDTPAGFRPIVQAIDDYHRNHKLGAIFEARVGAGKLLICGFDLRTDLQKRPATRQLLHSLLAYVGGEHFDPKTWPGDGILEKLLGPLRSVKTVAQPPDLRRAVLRVRAAVNVPTMEKNTPWQRKLDKVITAKKGFGYQPRNAGTWRDGTGSSWHGGRLGLLVRCPAGFAGTLYVHFHDWNRHNRRGVVTFEGKRPGTLGDHTGPGRWVAFDVTREHSADGKLELETEATAGPNLQITQIVLVPG